jgi:methylmalonyl-CoA mutase
MSCGLESGREIDHASRHGRGRAPYHPGMPAPSEPLRLAGEFPTATEDDWRALVAAVLQRAGRGADGDPVDALTHPDYDGIGIRPLYTASEADPGRPGEPPYVRGTTSDGASTTGWDVRTLHGEPDAGRVRVAALADLETGATSLWLRLGDGGLAVADLVAALDGVYLDLAPVVLDAGTQTRAAAAAFLDLLATRGVAAAEVRGSLGADPIGVRAGTGTDADLALLGELADLARTYPNLTVATVDAPRYADAGASDAQEIAVATAVGVAYLRALTDAGAPLDAALAALEFRFAVTAEQFASIAKLRAARQVWGRVAELCGAGPTTRGQRQHAVTAAAMLTRHDPWVNMLRTTIGCFAAAVGGAEAITVLPFDSALGLPDDFGRRIARNTHAILHDESSLARVIDAAGGSWYVETLTAELARAAWATFTEIERAGGALAALDGGLIPELIGRTRAVRDDDIAHRRKPITGVSVFALPDEAAVPRRAAPERPAGGPLPTIRQAEAFEQLRDEVENSRPRPVIFLAVLGPLPAHSARLGFARNLFNAGGFRVAVGDPADFADSDAAVACLCSSDEFYEREGAAAADALRSSGAKHIWLAGRANVPGVDGRLFAGCDALAALRTTLEAST